MRGLKKIALTGRAVCATIHQPSIAIFNSFDSLLLLKRGGETVFFGELGAESSKLIEYLGELFLLGPSRVSLCSELIILTVFLSPRKVPNNAQDPSRREPSYMVSSR
jgi:hypothetical protein